MAVRVRDRRFPRVAALLVSHDGARWLPAVIDGIRAQRAPVDRSSRSTPAARTAAPTCSRPPSATCSRAHRLRRRFPAAVELGLERLREPARDREWVWLLHDDANPDPGALPRCSPAAADRPDADVLGPKLREWPSLKRLLELGVTISGTGRRETGLERGEYDQGQHDEVREVLAVNTAGMLVRRTVLEELGGFDRPAADLRQRHRLRLARRRGRPPHAGRARRPSSSTPRRRTAASAVRR